MYGKARLYQCAILTSLRPYMLARKPLINYVMSLAHRLICNQGATLTGFCSCKTCISTILAVKACVGLVKSCNVECGSACEPHRAGSKAHIYGVALLTKDLGHLPRSASCSCTLQNPQRYDIIDQRFLTKCYSINITKIGVKHAG